MSDTDRARCDVVLGEEILRAFIEEHPEWSMEDIRYKVVGAGTAILYTAFVAVFGSSAYEGSGVNYGPGYTMIGNYTDPSQYGY